MHSVNCGSLNGQVGKTEEKSTPLQQKMLKAKRHALAKQHMYACDHHNEENTTQKHAYGSFIIPRIAEEEGEKKGSEIMMLIIMTKLLHR